MEVGIEFDTARWNTPVLHAQRYCPYARKRIENDSGIFREGGKESRHGSERLLIGVKGDA